MKRWRSAPAKGGRQWTAAELAALQRLTADGIPHAEIARILDRTTKAVSVRVSREGWATHARAQWTTGERARLRELSATMSARECAEAMGRTVGSVESMAAQMHLHFRRDRRRQWPSG